MVGASGTGIQEVTTLVHRLGGGISHAIGTGGRDLHAAIGGLTTLQALDALAADAATRDRRARLQARVPEVAAAWC